MLCPLTYNAPKGASHLVCRGKSCAWWNEKKEMCAILAIVKQEAQENDKQ